ncbi:type III-B CRISPR-associated protein Cas10/Cmr2 [Trichothermofontia sp.]
MLTKIDIGIIWCLAWGSDYEPQLPLDSLQQIRQTLKVGKVDELPIEIRSLVNQVQQCQQISFPERLTDLKQAAPELWQQTTPIGLVYGGATKIKQYVFESAKLPDIRGASALLDRINLFDLPAFFNHESENISQWLDEHFQGLRSALIPEMIIYSTGGNILAFCPAAYVDILADAIERRYTDETLTANSCAVGSTFRLLELRLGLLGDPLETTPWLDWLQRSDTQDNPVVKAYFNHCQESDFRNRKNFNELVTKLAIVFNQRRSGNDTPNRLSRRYPPMFETHPYLRRDLNDRRSAIAQVNLGDRPWLSESLARKRLMGQLTKREFSQLPDWFERLQLDWQPLANKVSSWVASFEQFLNRNVHLKQNYYLNSSEDLVTEARTLRELGNSSQVKGFVAYIYADGNNMGGYIQHSITTPQGYQKFSEDVFKAVQESVYYAIAQHLHPRQLQGLTDADNQHRNGEWIHPFEIVAIGGDDVLLIVPADQVLSIAKTIGEEFEAYLQRINLDNGQYIYRERRNYLPKQIHRYTAPNSKQDLSDHAYQCQLSLSTGVLITAESTPIYYAEDLVSQLLKSAKKRAKDLRDRGYLGGTIDFLTLKSITMLSDKIEAFRQSGLTKTLPGRNQVLKQYAAPYTLYEIGGLLETIKALKQVQFSKSQLYQIRRLLAQSKQTAILNYRYFRVRMSETSQRLLQQEFEEPWCKAKTNNGNLAPWMSILDADEATGEGTIYETIWRDIVDLYEFVQVDEVSNPTPDSAETMVGGAS